MNKPNFLCIGAPKCGTTWLYEILMSHPDVFLPEEIKEIHYFDRYFDRGALWYSKLFDKKADNQICGEVTPHYLYIEDCNRIYEYNPEIKLVLIYRDPMNRCVSHFNYRNRLDGFKGSLSEFIDEYPMAIEWGLYGKHLSRFLEIFPREQILIVKFEDATKNVEKFIDTLSVFLEIDSDKFPIGVGNKKVNQHIQLKNPRIYRLSVKLSRLMVDIGLYKLRNKIKSLLLPLLKKESNAFGVNSQVHKDELNKLKKYFVHDQILLQQIVNDER